jgi:hypothetical protein
MKKWIKITGAVLVIVILIILGFLNYVMNGNVIPYYSCGYSFSSQFKEAIKDNDMNFCSEFNEDINQYKNFKGGTYCFTPNVGLMDNKISISEIDFEDNCLMAMMEATNNIEYCMQSTNLQEMCPYRLVYKTGNKDYCEYIPKASAVYEDCIER